MITKEEKERALEKAKAIRETCRDVYDKGLKGEDVIGPLSDIYQKAYEIDSFIDSLPTMPPAPAPQPTPTTGA